MSESRVSLRTRITALCAATAILLALIAAGAAAVAVNNRRGLDDVLTRIGPLGTASDGLLIALLNQETGVRGYATNGSDADLATYDDGRKQEQEATDQLNEGLGGRQQLLAKLRLAENSISDWHATVADPVIARVRSGDRAGGERLVNDTARATFDRVRGALTDLQSAIRQVRDTAVDQLTANSRRIIQLLIAAALVVLVAGVLLAVLLRYLVTTPVNRLAGAVRRVAAGDYGHVVDADGPSEVAALARDVDGMRRKIVKDLGEVRAARAAVEEANQRLEAQAVALQAQAAELTRSNRDLEQFAYVASHDLQEPLRKVASFCQLLQRRYAGQLDERADQYIGFAVDGAQRMQRLINDLLAFSRIGRVTSGFTDVDLNALVEETVSQQEATLERTGGEVTWDALPVVRGEEALLAALIGNLVSNSLKFRRPDVPPRVHLSARRVDDEGVGGTGDGGAGDGGTGAGGAWEISCRDNGIGIEPEFGDKVFVIFQRLHGKGAYPGTGIGLAIAKKIVEYHGGRIWLAPAPDHGADIRFTLPVERPAELPVSPAPVGASKRMPDVDTGTRVDTSTSKETIP